MKQLLTALLIILFTTITTSCQGPEGPMGPMGPSGEGTSWATQSYHIKASDWKLQGKTNELNSYYYVNISIPDLDKNIFQYGSVLAYLETEPGIKNGLPYVSHRGGKDNLGEFLWTQTYDFDFYPGGATIYLTYSDFNTTVRPSAETIHFILMW